MRSPFTILIVLFLIQLLSNGVESQVFAPITDIIVPTASKPTVSHSASPKPTITHVSSSSFTPIIPLTSSTAPSKLPISSSIVPSSSSSTLPILTTPTTAASSTSITSSSSLLTSSSSSITATPSTSPPSNNDNEISTPTIIGAVVGGVVGLALLGGVMTWLNRRGGCTSKTNQRKANFEDFGLAERDFPHHRSPTAQPAMVSSSGFGGSTVIASPTLPRLNNQGNYYDDGAKHYPPPQPIYDNTAYYYPQDHPHTGYDTNGGYYDENGYYYDGQTEYIGTQTGYGGHAGYNTMTEQTYHPPYSPTRGGPPEVYKPNVAPYR